MRFLAAGIHPEFPAAGVMTFGPRRQALIRPSLGLSMAGLASRGRAKAGGDYDAGSVTSNTSST